MNRNPLKNHLVVLFAAIILLVTVLGPISISMAGNKDNKAKTYIIVFHDDVDVESALPDVARVHGIKARYEYRNAVHGMTAQLSESKLNALRNDPRVAFVEEDAVVTSEAQTNPTGIRRVAANTSTSVPYNNVDDVRVDVDVAVLDTGIDLQHPDLYVVNSTNCMSGVCMTGGDDDQYHGTHVAGTIAALDNDFGVVGVAPGARLWAVKVLDSSGNGTISTVIAGLDYVTANAHDIEVVNMSLSCECPSEALDQAIANAVNAGVTVVTSAGNLSRDAADTTPANNPNVITVSAIADFDGAAGGLGNATCRNDQDDTLGDFSNFGAVVDITAPGTCIYSTYPIEKLAYGTATGTSMAAPHVTGAAALLAASNPAYTPAEIKQILIDNGSYDYADTSGDGVQEPLLNVSNLAVFAPATYVGTPVGNQAPYVRIKTPANNASFGATSTVGFSVEAADPETGYASSGVVWSSSISGYMGTGSSVNRNLSAGTHVVTATSTDAQGLSTSVSITVTFGSGATATALPTNTAVPTATSTPLPTSTSIPTNTPEPTATNTPLPTNTAVPTNLLVPTLTTNKASYTNGQKVTITATVMNGTTPVKGVAVKFTVTTSNGTKTTKTVNTTASGIATMTYTVSTSKGKGSYTIEVIVTKSGYTNGTGVMTFQVN
jgi:subtilisin